MAGQDSIISYENEISETNCKVTDEESHDQDQRAQIVKLGHGHDDHHDHKSCTGHVDPVQRLVKGFKHFLLNEYWKYPEKFNQLAQSQHPKFLVFSCSDSRVSPSHVLDFQLGEAFMARNIGNLVPSFNKLRYSDVGTIIEYSMEDLKVENILVIGHSRCGGITRLMSEDTSEPSDFIDDWVNIALPAKIKVKAEYGHLPLAEQIDICVQEAVNLSLRNLLTYPYVKRAFDEGKLALRGGFYDFVVGSLRLWEMKKSTISSPIVIDCHN